MPKRDVVLVMNLALRPSRGGVARAQTVAPAAGGNGVADAWRVAVIPAGAIAASNVQAALEELDVEKASIAELGDLIAPLLLNLAPDEVLVNDLTGVPLFVVSRVAQYGRIGAPTIPGIEWDANEVRVAGAPVAPVLRHEETWTPGPINSMDVAIWDVTVPGAMPGDFVGAAHDMMSRNALLISAFCWSADNVRVVIFNTEHGQVNVPEGTLRVMVWK